MPSPDENKKVNEGFFRMLNSEPRNGAGAFLNNYEERMNVQIGSPFLKVLQEEKVEEDTYYNLVCRIDKLEKKINKIMIHLGIDDKSEILVVGKAMINPYKMKGGQS